MPVKIRKLDDDHYEVRTPNAVHAKRTTMTNAMRQARLLNAIDHGFDPDKRPQRRAK